jgi:hypothetical protein
MIPMLKIIPLKQAAKVTVIVDTVSIASMETIENTLAFPIPEFTHTFLQNLVLVRPRKKLQV